MSPLHHCFSARLLLMALLGLLLNGCATQTLWEKSFSSPAPEPNVRLYASRQPGQVLVAYDALDEERGTLRRRVYSLSQNARRIQEARKPQFLDLTVLDELPLIPLAESPPASEPAPSAGLYAVLRPSPLCFTLHAPGKNPETYDLPTYVAGAGLTTQILLTPVAVVVDLTVVGAVVAYYTAEMWGPALSGRSF